MIVKIDKEFTTCKIGVLGLRKNILDSCLKHAVIDCVRLDNHDEIDDTFDFVFIAGYYHILPSNIISRVFRSSHSKSLKFVWLNYTSVSINFKRHKK